MVLYDMIHDMFTAVNMQIKPTLTTNILTILFTITDTVTSFSFPGLA